MADAEQMGLFETVTARPAGFKYHVGLLSKAEESELAARITGLPFVPFEFHGFLGKRRTVSYGWRYAFDGSGMLTAADPIPDFLMPLRERAARRVHAEPSTFEHMLVTEYAPGAAIGWHRDRSVFGETIAISLLAACRLRFRRHDGTGWERMSVTVEPRSLYLLSGPSRSEWEHSIPALEKLRYSITLRNLAKNSFRE